ncbi:MAG: tRNA (adenosine(37)-N6)-dimethylallyltransferase MiaA [Paracoccaceae bacterium]
MKPARNLTPILICGPTASGKSALGMAIANQIGGCVINADALQVYENWRVLSARPSIIDEQHVSHRLYGHVAGDTHYSVGAWLRDVESQLDALTNTGHTPIILGGTGLYFSTLTQGLAQIPTIPVEIRLEGDRMRASSQTTEFIHELQKFDPQTLVNIDQNNPMRLQRAWEVWQSTNKGLFAWQKDTPAPLIALENAVPIVLNANTDWLNKRISGRFEQMISDGAIAECQAVLEKGWDPALPSSRALGAAEIIAYLQGENSLEQAKEKASIATRQFAKRQRTWFRSKMKLWQHVDIEKKNTKDTVLKMLTEE